MDQIQFRNGFLFVRVGANCYMRLMHANISLNLLFLTSVILFLSLDCTILKLVDQLLKSAYMYNIRPMTQCTMVAPVFGLDLKIFVLLVAMIISPPSSLDSCARSDTYLLVHC